MHAIELTYLTATCSDNTLEELDADWYLGGHVECLVREQTSVRLSCSHDCISQYEIILLLIVFVVKNVVFLI